MVDPSITQLLRSQAEAFQVISVSRCAHRETQVGEEQTRLLNHAFAWVTPAIFVIFVVFGGLSG